MKTGGKTIYIDPYEGEYDEKADLVLSTHHHDDHCKTDKIKKVMGDNTVIVATPECGKKIGSPVKTLKPGESAQFGDVTVTAVAYVTESTLQRSFPPAPGRFTTHFSSIRLPEEWIRPAPRAYATPIDRPAIVCIGSMSTHYKGQDVLLRAVEQCLGRGVEIEVTLIGDGACREEFERLARQLGIDDRVDFLGSVPHGKAILEQLDRADLCVMPSRTEGLPRAMGYGL